MLPVGRARSLARELHELEESVGLEHLADLLPRGVHVLFLIALDDLRSEPGSDAPPGIEVEVVDPVLGMAHR